MKNIRVVRVAILAAVMALTLALVSGCATTQTTENTSQSKSRAYMSKVNQLMDSVSGDMTEVADAVAKGDAVTAKVKVENAMTEVSKISAIEAPENLADVKAKYDEGCKDLSGALKSMTDLFVEIEGSGNASSFDSSAYSSRISAIQDQYNKGVSEMKEADSLAASKE